MAAVRFWVVARSGFPQIWRSWPSHIDWNVLTMCVCFAAHWGSAFPGCTKMKSKTHFWPYVMPWRLVWPLNAMSMDYVLRGQWRENGALARSKFSNPCVASQKRHLWRCNRRSSTRWCICPICPTDGEVARTFGVSPERGYDTLHSTLPHSLVLYLYSLLLVHYTLFKCDSVCIYILSSSLYHIWIPQ